MAIATGTALAIAGAASLAGGAMSYASNKSAQDRAEMLNNSAVQQWLSLNLPDPEAQKLALQKFVVEGQLDPKLEQAIKADPSAFEKIIVAPKYAEAQNRALDELSSIGYEGGLRLQDKAALQDAQQDAIVKDRAQREGIAAQMQRQGMGGSGFEVAAQLQGQQGTADRMANSSLHTAAMAQQRALDSIMGAGELAGKYRGQDFQENSAKAAAADKINLFNTENLRDIQSRNIGSQNRAAEMNLAEKQRISEQNIKQSNYQQEYNRKLLQQDFDNQAKKTAGMTGQLSGMAGTAMAGGQNLGNLYSNMGQGISQSATSAAQMGFWDDYFKKNKAAPTGGT